LFDFGWIGCEGPFVDQRPTFDPLHVGGHLVEEVFADAGQVRFLDLDAELFRALAQSRGQIGFARAHMPAHRGVPEPRKTRLACRAPLQQNLSAPVPDHHVDRAMPQSLAMREEPRNPPDHPVLVVDMVQRLA